MYDEKEVLLSYIESEKYEAAKETAKETAVQMLRMGKLSVDEIARYVPALSMEEIHQHGHCKVQSLIVVSYQSHEI
jgi:hypothetical protein